MPRACTICTLPDRSALEEAIAFGQGLRDAARTFNVSHQALLRHLRHHHVADHQPVVSDQVTDHKPMHAAQIERSLSPTGDRGQAAGQTERTVSTIVENQPSIPESQLRELAPLRHDPEAQREPERCSLCGTLLDTSRDPWRDLDTNTIHFVVCPGTPALHSVK